MLSTPDGVWVSTHSTPSINYRELKTAAVSLKHGTFCWNIIHILAEYRRWKKTHALLKIKPWTSITGPYCSWIPLHVQGDETVTWVAKLKKHLLSQTQCVMLNPSHVPNMISSLRKVRLPDPLWWHDISCGDALTLQHLSKQKNHELAWIPHTTV